MTYSPKEAPPWQRLILRLSLELSLLARGSQTHRIRIVEIPPVHKRDSLSALGAVSPNQKIFIRLCRRLPHKEADADYQQQGHDTDLAFPSRPPSSRGILSPPPLLALFYDFAQIHNRPYLNRPKSILKARLL